MKSAPPVLLASLALAFCCSAAVGLNSADALLRPFTAEWPRDASSPASVSFLLEAPAGQGGFVRAKDGHLVRPDGRRFRIWGINVTMQAGLPPQEDAPVIAAHLARLGLNCVRFHFLDRPAPQGIIDATRNDTRALDSQQLDRLDFFIAELKKRGIYSDLNLNVGRTYKAGDGVRDHELLGFAKSLTYFDGRLLELQREYARQLLTHVNPYTGAAYGKEPAVALIEFVNENSLIEAWADGRLRGEATRKNPGTWTDIPASYAAALTEKYNAWLRTKFPAETLAAWRRGGGLTADGPIPRLKPAEFARAARDRFHAEAEFYLEVEREFFTGMAKYLRDDLGVKPLLVGNSDHGHHRTGYPQLIGTSLLDVVDSHVYWQHPRYLEASGRRAGFDIPNTPMVDDPLHSTVVQLSRSAVAGKPFTVSEVNHPFPNEYACEGVPILAAYAALQDWDGVFWYTLAHRNVLALEPAVAGHFDFARDPVKMTQLGAGALIFLRGDVRSARRTVERSYTREQVRESIRLPYSESPYFTPGFPLATPLQHATRISSFDGPATGAFDRDDSNPIRSDTGELTWTRGAKGTGFVTVETEGTEAWIGFATESASLRHLGLAVTNRFCAVILSALDAQPIGRSAKLLLTGTANLANTGQVWNAQRTSLEQWGTAPTRIEVVSGKVLLRQLAPTRSVRAQPLDGAGHPSGKALDATKTGSDWQLNLGEPATTWFVIAVER